jgi:hypothetical protein
MHRLTFVPTSLPLGTGPVPPDIQVAFNKTMKVMAKVDFPSLSASKSFAWNVVLSQTCLCLTRECLHLQRLLEVFRQTNQQEVASHKKMEFVQNLNIRTHFKSIFVCFPFPSHLEVTTTIAASLPQYRLSSMSFLPPLCLRSLYSRLKGTQLLNSFWLMMECPQWVVLVTIIVFKERRISGCKSVHLWFKELVKCAIHW